MTTSQQRLADIEKQEKALKEEKKKLLEASKADDLATVKRLCKAHGFTATQLRGSLKTKGGKTKADDGEAKTPAKKTATKKTAKK